jgi:UDP-glucose 4-epimerase
MNMDQEAILRGFYSGKSILVTGGAGAIGSNLSKKLVALGARVVVVDDLSSGFIDNIHPIQDGMSLVRGDIAEWDALKPQLPKRVDLVFHLAAFFANQNSVEFPERDLATNGMGTLNICRWASETGVGRLVFSSSSCVYGAASGQIDEETPLDPHTPYAITKVLGEQYVQFHHRHCGLDAVILRYFNSYGPGEYPGMYRNVIPNFIDKARRGEALPLTGNGRETRDFTFVGDTVSGTLLAGMKTEASGGIFNIGTGRETHIGDLAVHINELVENSAGCTYLPRRDWDRIDRRLACIDRARNVLGYDPSTSLLEGLDKTRAWFEQVAPRREHSMASVG